MPHNKPTASNADALTPVSQGLDNLFKSLIILKQQLNPLFSDEQNPSQSLRAAKVSFAKIKHNQS